jgi:aminopeptidase N
MKSILTTVLFLISVLSLSASDGYKRNPMIDVINYNFRISISDTSDTVYGEATILLSFKDEICSMEFDLKNLKPDGKGMNVDSVVFSECAIKWVHHENKISVTPQKALKNSSNGTLRIVYHGIPSDGLIISKNKFKDRTFFSDHWPDRASNYLPCVDHPYDKATVDFIIIAPEHYEIVASGYLLEESHLQSNLKMTHWKEEVPLATKVMAFGAADFDFKLAGIADNIPVWTYVYKENRSEGFSDYAVAIKPVSFFSNLIGNFPYEKLANVQSKTIFGGLENASCIFYSENSVTGKGKAENLIVHEVAHQWFGNSVTENDWYHIWLSEGFATYLTAVYLEKNYGREQLTSEMKTCREHVLNYYLRSPFAVIDTTVTSLMRLLNANTYQKGAWVLHMLRRDLGDDIFWKGIRSYYERYKNGNALTADFERVMEETGGKDLRGFFNQWLYLPGQPDLKITSKPAQRREMTEITIEQTQPTLFSFPLELLINSQEGTFRETIRVTERISKLTVKTGKVNEITPDPDVNLLFRLMKD